MRTEIVNPISRYVKDNFAEEADRIVLAMRKMKKGLVAPNGKPSNLPPELWLVTRLQSFRAWFGDWENDPKNARKILDENGEPRVVYYVTDGGFTVFDLSQARQNMDIPAFFFSGGTEDWADMGSRVMACFLNIRNPKKGKPIVRGNGREVREQLVAEGYDGTIDADEDVEVDFTRELAGQDLKRFSARTKRRLDKSGLDAVEQVMDDKRMDGIELPDDAALDDILKEFGRQRFMAVLCLRK